MNFGKRSGYNLITIACYRKMETILVYTTRQAFTATFRDEGSPMKLRALLAVLAVAVLAACTSPTASNSTTQQPDPGVGFGSPATGTGR